MKAIIHFILSVPFLIVWKILGVFNAGLKWASNEQQAKKKDFTNKGEDNSGIVGDLQKEIESLKSYINFMEKAQTPNLTGVETFLVKAKKKIQLDIYTSACTETVVIAEGMTVHAEHYGEGCFVVKIINSASKTDYFPMERNYFEEHFERV